MFCDLGVCVSCLFGFGLLLCYACVWLVSGLLLSLRFCDLLDFVVCSFWGLIVRFGVRVGVLIGLLFRFEVYCFWYFGFGCLMFGGLVLVCWCGFCGVYCSGWVLS